MGQLRLAVPDRDRLPGGAAEYAYLTGMEAVPFPSRNTWDGHLLTITRDVRESGTLNLLWNVPKRGPLLLSTASLMERERPYLLTVELARGTLNRLRNQQAVWQTMGLAIPPAYDALVAKAMHAFGRSVTQQANPLVACNEANTAIGDALTAIDLLATAYIDQVLELRHEQTARLATISGCTLPNNPPNEADSRLYTTAFNAAVVAFNWKQIEPAEGEYDWSSVDRQFQWLKGKPLKVCSSPLLRLDAQSIPDWLYLWDDDFEALQSYMQGFVAAAVNRYRGQVHVWNTAVGLNLPGGLPLVEEQKLRIAVVAIDAVRRNDPRTPVIVSFDRPWGEYLQQEEMDLPPYHFADALIRADLGLSGVGLELNLGYSPGGTLPRDVLELSRLIDRWSTLGAPLLTFLASPSHSLPPGAATPKVSTIQQNISPASQAAEMQLWLQMLTAKQSVHGVFWNHFTDVEPQRWPHSGLLDAAGNAKPLLRIFADLRRLHLA